MLSSIEDLARAGFAIHWLKPKSKAPIGNDWSEKPVRSLSELRRSYRDGNNVGVRLGKWSEVGGGYLHVLDMDIRVEGSAEEAIEKLDEMFPGWSDFPIVKSGSGGKSRHIYFLCDRAFSSHGLANSGVKFVDEKGTKHWTWEIELFGTGKQVAMPPSIHPDTGNAYRWIRPFDSDELKLGLGPMIDSKHLEELIERDDDQEEVDPDDERMKPLGISADEVRDLLAKLPNEDRDYDDWLNVMASVQHEASGRSLAERKEFYKVFRDWSARSPKHDDKTAKYKFFSFKNRGNRRHRTIRSVQAEVDEYTLEQEFDNLDDFDEFDDLGDEEDTFDDLLGGGNSKPAPVSKRQQKLNKADVDAQLGNVPPKIKRLNKKHAVAFVNGKTVIITEKRDGNVTYGTVGDLHNYYENDRVATEKATEPVTKAWMRHKKRREYPEGIVFSPGQEVEGAYNHWRGFSVEPDPKASCRLILSHLRKVICNDDEIAHRYSIGWWAHLVQRPEEKPGVAMVLRGKKGAGKDTIADYIGGLFPHHHVKIASQEHMVGRFNQHQEKCLLLHVEEGFWAGNKQAEGSLKHLITSEKVFIEPKGLNGFHVQSVLRLFMSSNEQWVVPATEDERRYFVLDVPSTRKNDHRYFEAIRKEMNSGGREALLHYLMNYDLTGFNVRDVPNTAALAEQKVQELKNIDRWWFGFLESRELPVETFSGNGKAQGDWAFESVLINCDEFREAYSRWMRSQRYEGTELSDFDMGKRLRNFVPDLVKRRLRSQGRSYSYALPPLEMCRQSFERWIGSEMIWDDAITEEVVDDTDDIEDEFDDFD